MVAGYTTLTVTQLPLSPPHFGILTSDEPFSFRFMRGSHAAMSLSASPASCFLFLFLFLLPLPPCQPESQRSQASSPPDLRTLSPTVFPSTFPPSASYGKSNGTATSNKCNEVPTCRQGILLPVWKPNRPGLGDQVARAVVYFVSLMYMFLGVSIIADRFMASIEVITSQVRTGHLKWRGVW